MSGLSPAFRALLAEVGERPDDSEVLNDVCRACVAELGVDGAGMTMILGGKAQGRLGVSDVDFGGVEDLQYTAGEGPCLDAYASGRVVSEPALAHTRRWPGFAPGAVQRGLGAVFAFPLQIGRARFGALDLYRVMPGPLPGDVYDNAVTVAHGVSAALLTMLAETAPGFVPIAIDGFGDSGVVVHQAAGMVSVQMNLSIEDALVALRARAYAIGSTVREVAARVVDRQLRFDGDGG